LATNCVLLRAHSYASFSISQCRLHADSDSPACLLGCRQAMGRRGSGHHFPGLVWGRSEQSVHLHSQRGARTWLCGSCCCCACLAFYQGVGWHHVNISVGPLTAVPAQRLPYGIMVRPPHLPKGGISQLWCALGPSSLNMLNVLRGDSKRQCERFGTRWSRGGTGLCWQDNMQKLVSGCADWPPSGFTRSPHFAPSARGGLRRQEHRPRGRAVCRQCWHQRVYGLRHAVCR